MKLAFKVYDIDKEPYGIFLTAASFEEAKKLIQEDIQLEQSQGFEYTEDDYLIKPVYVYACDK